MNKYEKFDFKNKELLQDPEIGAAINKVAMARLEMLLADMESENKKFSDAKEALTYLLLEKFSQGPEQAFKTMDTDFEARQRRLVNNPFMSQQFREQSSDKYGIPLDLQNFPFPRTMPAPEGPAQINKEVAVQTNNVRITGPKAKEAPKPPKEMPKKDIEADIPKVEPPKPTKVIEPKPVSQVSDPWTSAVNRFKTLGDTGFKSLSSAISARNSATKGSDEYNRIQGFINQAYDKNPKPVSEPKATVKAPATEGANKEKQFGYIVDEEGNELG